MPRHTKKYIAACRVAGLNPDDHPDHDVLYSYLHNADYRWNGEAWVIRAWASVSKRAAIRIVCDPADLAYLQDIVERALIEAAIDISSTHGPYQNDQSRQIRVYYNLSFARKVREYDEP